MYGIGLGIGGFGALLILISLRFPIALAMLLVGGIGHILLEPSASVFNRFYSDPYYIFSSHYLAVIPLFLLMGQFAFHGGMSRSLFNFVKTLLGERRLGTATIGACAIFGSICGSSLATVATMSKVAIPEMLRHNYSKPLTAGIIAAGGTLGTLIPPSIVLIIYSVLTEQNLAKMFLAALVPGIIAMIGYMLAAQIGGRLYSSRTSPIRNSNPAQGPGDIPSDIPNDIKGSISIILILIVAIGGIYTGLFTPTEGASIGCVLTAGLALFNKQLNKTKLVTALQETAVTSGMIYMILLGASFFSSFLALSQLPTEIAAWIADSAFNPYLVLLIILAIYLALGCMMDTIAMLILTLPIFFPIIQVLDFGLSPEETALWFGVLALITVEIGLITPPLGLNIFVITSLHKNITARDCYIGVIPFLISDILRIVILIAIPSITLLAVKQFG
ncbi:MAG: TRAP transporter large permease [Gammaproteobacteria bacterium]|nr:TRAP transporter large permease [Gammaproteobacteria bacterium]